MLILNAEEVYRALPMSLAIDAMKRALKALSCGQAKIPLRTHIDIEKNQGTTLIMPGLVEDQFGEALAVKVVSIFNQNKHRSLPNILGVVNVLDPQTGRPVAILDGSAVTAIRTAATSGAATDVLARTESARVAIIGSGTQAKSHFQAMCAVRNIEQATFYAPNRQKLEALVAELDSDANVVIADSSAEATRDADIICTTTNSSTPVLDDEAVPPGCHINAIGSYKPSVVEIPGATVVRSSIYVDHIETALSEAGDLIQPLNLGDMKRDRIVGEIGRMFDGSIEGRQNDQDVTLFKSVGNTVEDVVAARMIVDRARELGLGQEVDF